MTRVVDVHQHLWPAALIDALRARHAPPYLRGWTLVTAGEAPYEVAAADHDVAARAAAEAGTSRALVSLSTPLGIEALPPHESQPLLDAWHRGAAELPAPFEPWAAVNEAEPDLDGLKGLLTGGFVGVQISALLVATPRRVEAAAPLLRLCEELDAPVLVHPGPVGRARADGAAGGDGSPRADGSAGGDGLPVWWPALVDYPAQLQSAWWAWHAVGRGLLPRLRLCFVAGAGLAALQHERFAARGGGRFVVDHDAFLDCSSYGRQGIDALTRTLGIDVVVLGSDRPYAEPVRPDRLDLGDAAWHAVSVANPTRLLEGSRS